MDQRSVFIKTVLDNGLTVISEKIESVRSIAVGVWVRTGSRQETAEENGIAHFLEHMMFKGTVKRTPLKIAQSLELLGGNINAFTGKELTCFFANALDIHLKRTIEVLSDIVCNSIFPEKEINKEKMVVLEEINSVKDTPEEYIFDLFQDHLFPDSSLGRPILGSESNVRNFNREKVVDFWQKHYLANRIVIAAAGNLEHHELVRIVEKYFALPGSEIVKVKTKINIARTKKFEFNQPINQAHLCIGGESIPYTSNYRFPLLVLNTYLGGGMSSRLFQRLRERYGLAYSVYSFTDFYFDVGVFGVYIGTDPHKIVQVNDLLLQELNTVTRKPLTAGVVRKLKNQLKGSLVLGLENTSRRMSRLAKNELYYGEQISIDTLIEKIDSVTPDEILEIAQNVLKTDSFINVTLRSAS